MNASRSGWLPEASTATPDRAAACEAMDIASTSGNLKELRRQLRNLNRQRLRQQRAELLTWTPLQHIQLKAVVMLILCGDTKWPIFYVKRWQWRHINRTMAMPCETTAAVLQQWQVLYATHPRVREMLQNLDDPDRVQIDLFLVQSMVYEEIEINNNKGLSVPASSVVASFIRKCSFRPPVASVQRLIRRLEEEAAYRRTWGRCFRKTWLLSWGCVDKVPTMTSSEVVLKAPNTDKNQCTVHLGSP